MLVTFSGYNASGKTTAIRAVAARLSAEGVPTRIVRFFSLDVSRRLRPRPPSPGRIATSGVPSVRASERQPGKTRKTFRWYHLAKMLAMAVQIIAMRLLWPREMLLSSQYFYDNLVHFEARGFWYHMAVRLTPRPSMAFLLMVDMTEYERRFIDRLQQRHGVRIERLPERDLADIRSVLARYGELRREFPYVRFAQATSHADLDAIWSDVRQLVQGRHDVRASESQT